MLGAVLLAWWPTCEDLSAGTVAMQSMLPGGPKALAQGIDSDLGKLAGNHDGMFFDGKGSKPFDHG